MDVSYRSIAKLLAHGIPVDGQDYSDMIEAYIKSIEAMPPEHQHTLSASYIFSSLARTYERQDLFQELVAYTLTELAKYDGRIKDLEAFCYTVAKHKWGDWWKQKKRRKRILNGGFLSLNQLVRDCDSQEIELHETIAGEVEFESNLNSELDSQAVLNSLPDRVRTIAEKRLLNCEKLSSSECNILWRYAKQSGDTIRELLRA